MQLAEAIISEDVNDGPSVLLTSYLASLLDVSVWISLCVFVCACVHLTPTLQPSSRRSTKVSTSTAERGRSSTHSYFKWFTLKYFAIWAKLRAQLGACDTFSELKRFWMTTVQKHEGHCGTICMKLPVILITYSYMFQNYAENVDWLKCDWFYLPYFFPHFISKLIFLRFHMVWG